MRSIRLVLPIMLGAVLAASGATQGTKADYERAQGLRERYQYLAAGVADAPVWIGKTSRFYYRVTIKGGHEFVMVDAATQQKQPAFITPGSRRRSRKCPARRSPTARRGCRSSIFTFNDDEKSIDVSIERARWICTLANTPQGAGPERPRAVRRTPP